MHVKSSGIFEILSCAGTRRAQEANIWNGSGAIETSEHSKSTKVTIPEEAG